MKRKGFTLVELLVVIAIIALLMGILMPTLSRVRLMAQKLVCGSRQAGIVKACITYAAENNKDFPTCPIKYPAWSTRGELYNWDEIVGTPPYPIAWYAYGYTKGKQAPTYVTVSSSLYLLVKYFDVSTDQFICKGDTGATPFKIQGSQVTAGLKTSTVWDFGGGGVDWPGYHVSYAYQMPFMNLQIANGNKEEPGTSGFHIIEFTPSEAPVLADRNPYLDKNITGGGGGQSFAHRKLDGMNVCYRDGHVEFETSSGVGINNDDIWSYWYTGTRKLVSGGNAGKATTDGENLAAPCDAKDAFLVMETNNR